MVRKILGYVMVGGTIGLVLFTFQVPTLADDASPSPATVQSADATPAPATPAPTVAPSPSTPPLPPREIDTKRDCVRKLVRKGGLSTTQIMGRCK